MDPDYFVGLDLGPASQLTGLAVVERSWKPSPGALDRLQSHYAVRHLHRWPVQTSYQSIAADLATLVRTPPLKSPVLVVDMTSVGRAVVELLKRSELDVWLRPVIITGGHGTSNGDGGALCVPKKDLVSCLQVVLQSRRLQIAPSLSQSKVLAEELLAFRMKTTIPANETLESWRERDHDDLVLAVALAVYWAERHSSYPVPPKSEPVITSHRSMADRVYGPSNAARRGLFGLGRRRSMGGPSFGV
jgi:hypothetical protein